MEAITYTIKESKMNRNKNLCKQPLKVIAAYSLFVGAITSTALTYAASEIKNNQLAYVAVHSHTTVHGRTAVHGTAVHRTTVRKPGAVRHPVARHRVS
jgi:hypothetical protein